MVIPRTAMEVYDILPEGTLCEVIDNTIYMLPSPTTNYQRLLIKIAAKLEDFSESNEVGKVFIAPCDVYLDNGQSVVQPDMFFVKREREHIIEKKASLVHRISLLRYYQLTKTMITSGSLNCINVTVFRSMLSSILKPNKCGTICSPAINIS